MKLKLQVYLAGEVVFKMGDVGHDMYFITKGHVSVLNSNYEMLAMLSVGGFFGELGLLATAHRTAHCVALCDCDLSVLTAHDLLGAMTNFPESATLVRQKAAKRLSELQAAGEAKSTVAVGKGVARHLQKLDRRFGSIRRDIRPLEQSPSKKSEPPSAPPDVGPGSLAYAQAAAKLLQPSKPVEQIEDSDEEEDVDDGSSSLQGGEDTMALLEKVQQSVSALTDQLGDMHAALDSINDRTMLLLEAAPEAADPFGEGGNVFRGAGREAEGNVDLEGFN